MTTQAVAINQSQDASQKVAADDDKAQMPPSVTGPAPIGIFDSGVGGLSVYMHLKQALPQEHFIYYADTLNVPYGPRPSSEIQQLSLTAVDWLVAAGCKLVVIACNSASAHALHLARQKYPHIPIVGLVPALKPAVLNSTSKNVAVLATKATLDGPLLNTVIDEYARPSQVTVIKWFDPELVPWVEAGMPMDSDTPMRLKQQLYQFAQQQADHLVLGCTHYPFFREFVLAEVAKQGLDIKVVDSGAAIAARVKALLQQQAAAESSTARLRHKFLLPTQSVLHSMQGLSVGHTTQRHTDRLSDLEPQHASSLAVPKLAFFVSDPKADLAQVSTMVQRLIYPV